LPPSTPSPTRPCDGCAIIVLAAGRGSRMGGPKALMPVRGQPWWMHQSRRLAELGGSVTWVVSAEVHAGIEPALQGDSPVHRIVVDSSAPMFHSVLAGVRSLHGTYEGVFILPIDVPTPQPETWRRLRLDPSTTGSSTPAPSSSPRVPTSLGQRGHPVFLPAAWIAASLTPRLPDLSGWNPVRLDPVSLAALAPFRLDTLIEPDRVLVPVDDPGVLINLNTPPDVDVWVRAVADNDAGDAGEQASTPM